MRVVSEEFTLNGLASEYRLMFYTSRFIRLRDIGYYITDHGIAGGTGFSVDVGLSGGTEIVNAAVQTTPIAAHSSKSLATNVDINPSSFVTVRIHTNSRTAGAIQFYAEMDN